MVKRKVLVDTNVIIDHLRTGDRQKITDFRKITQPEENLELIISVVTIHELFEGRSSRKRVEEGKIREVLSFFEIKSLLPEIAEKSGKLARDFGPIQLADAVIAATAILEKAFLSTKNKKDFKNIKGLKFYE